MRLIDADALEKTIRENIRRYYSMEIEETSGYCTATDAADEVMLAPTIDPEELRPKSEWIEREHKDERGDYVLFHCSRCDEPNARKKNYCPNCGAKMKV